MQQINLQLNHFSKRGCAAARGWGGGGWGGVQILLPTDGLIFHRVVTLFVESCLFKPG